MCVCVCVCVCVRACVRVVIVGVRSVCVREKALVVVQMELVGTCACTHVCRIWC